MDYRRSIWGEEIELTCKMDIFALGVLFHQYFTGELPGFNTEESTYSGEAVAKGEVLIVSSKLPNDLQVLLGRMLSNDPAERPTAIEVFNALRGIVASSPEHKDVSIGIATSVVDGVIPSLVIEESTTSGNPFFRPGDL